MHATCVDDINKGDNIPPPSRFLSSYTPLLKDHFHFPTIYEQQQSFSICSMEFESFTFPHFSIYLYNKTNYMDKFISLNDMIIIY